MQYFSCIAIFICTICIQVQAGAVKPVSLTCEGITNPLGIGTSTPALSWKISAGENGISQIAYEIMVSDNPQELKKSNGTCWNTGKINSPQSLYIPYAGKTLKPFTRYYWKVRIFDQHGSASEWSEAVWFETAMLNSSDWKAQWIGDGRAQFERDEDFYQDDPMPMFRKRFRVNKKIKSARLYISGLGYFEASLNGKAIGDHVLDPGWTAHRKQVLYVVHDVTNHLRQGNNTAGVMLGNGWYNPLPLQLFGRFNLRDHQQTGRPVLKAQLHIRYADETSEIIATDETWETARGPVIRNSVYLGERYDARLELDGWQTGAKNDISWKQVVREQGPDGELTPQMQPPVKIMERIPPVDIWEISPGVYIVDMGINFAGVAAIRIKGPEGTVIKLRYGENIHPDSTLNWLTTTPGHIKSMWGLKGGPGAPDDAIQEDVYILRGKGTETYMPRFTFHGFRYIEITGWPGKPAKNDIEGILMYADLPENGTFSCSNEMFNKLHEITKRTFLSNVFSVQSDCPGREKMGYGADIVVTAESFIYNFDMYQFYSKALRDFFNDQIPEGGITEIAPYTGIADRGIGGESGPLGWQLAFPWLMKQLYDFYGDRRILETYYPAFLRQMDFINSKADNYLFHWDIGDHNPIDPRADAFSASCFYYAHAILMEEFACILNKKEDEEKARQLCENIRKAIVKKYWIPGTGRFDNATQAAQLFALYYDLAPDLEATFQVLLSEYERHNWHLSTGIYATKMAFDIFRLKNRNDLAYRIADQRTYPGWGYMLSKGATTLWETWDYPDNAGSQNHPMFGTTEEWFYRSLLGINAAAAGFEEIIIKPQPVEGLTWAKGSYESVRGTIRSDWKIENGQYILKVEIPVNSHAVVYVPSDSKIPDNPGEFIGNEDGYARYKIPSGKFEFKSEAPPTSPEGQCR